MRTPATRRSERGFSLIEALIAIAILSGALLAFTSAMLGSAHATTRLVSRQTLTDAASDVLTDLKVAGAYQPEVLAALAADPPRPFTITRTNAAGDAVPVTIGERLRAANAPTRGWLVTVTATSSDGFTESLEQLVIQQAAAPGSYVTAEPSSDATPGSTLGDGGGASDVGLLGPAGAPKALSPTSAPPPPADADPAAAASGSCIDEGSCWPRGSRPIAR